MNIGDIFRIFLEDEKAQECAKWAFGERCDEFTRTKQFLNAWNQLHGKEVFLNGSGRPFDDIPKMIELWKKETEGKILRDLIFSSCSTVDISINNEQPTEIQINEFFKYLENYTI